MKPEKEDQVLWQSAQVMRPDLRYALVFALIAALLVLAPTFFMFEVYERVVNSRSLVTLGVLLLLVLFLVAIMEVLHWVQGRVTLYAVRRWEQGLMPRLVQVTFDINLRRGGGTTVQPLNDWRTLRDFAVGPFPAALMESPVALVFLGLLFVLNPLLGWVALGVVGVQGLLTYLNERATQPPLAKANQMAIEAQQYVDNSQRNAEVVEAMGMLRGVRRRWHERQNEMLMLQAGASDRAAGYQATLKLMQIAVGSAMLGLAAWMTLSDKLVGGAGMMIVASVLAGRVMAPMVQALAQWRTLVAARGAWDRLDQLLSQSAPVEPGMPLPPPAGRLSVESLVAGAPRAASGPPSAPILKGIQFTVAPGEMLAVVGPSGSGKSTLARLLVGLWPAMQGKVRLDGADVFEWNKDELGRHVGYLPQDVGLVEGTVGDNIGRFSQPPSPEALARAVALVGLERLLRELPQGLDTPVGRGGLNLSGGQRQRVALARALYGEPALLVLDEPSASLDDDGDRALLLALSEAKRRGAAVVVVTHRTHLLSLADKMLVLKDGQQHLFGPRDEVLASLGARPPRAAGAAHGGGAGQGWVPAGGQGR